MNLEQLRAHEIDEHAELRRQLLLGGLTVVTLLCAIAVFVILGRTRADDDALAPRVEAAGRSAS